MADSSGRHQELVREGSRARRQRRARGERAKIGGHLWSPAAEEAFFERLAAMRNVAAAAAAVGFSAATRAQRVRCIVQWSEAVEELFLDVLAASCNVSLAADEAGVGHSSVYRQRRTRADFAEKWQAALAQGYARLEMALVKAAIDSLAGTAFDAERPIPQMSAETAIRVLQLHRAAVTGIGRTSGWKAPPRGIEHYRASILRKVAAIKAARDGAVGRAG